MRCAAASDIRAVRKARAGREGGGELRATMTRTGEGEGREGRKEGRGGRQCDG